MKKFKVWHRKQVEAINFAHRLDVSVGKDCFLYQNQSLCLIICLNLVSDKTLPTLHVKPTAQVEKVQLRETVQKHKEIKTLDIAELVRRIWLESIFLRICIADLHLY